MSMCSPELTPSIIRRVASSPGDSDHCPITMSCMAQQKEGTIEADWNIRKAQWEAFTNSGVWRAIPENGNLLQSEELLNDLYNRINRAANEAIPRRQTGNLFPKPWWSLELKQPKQRIG